MADLFSSGDTSGAFTSRPDFDMSAFYAHVTDTWANPHPQYRWGTTPITTDDILDGTIAAVDLAAAVTAKFCITGEVKMWMIPAIPSGYLLLNGVAASRTDADLFALWGVTYGVGDGATTFGIPNFTLRIPIGLDAGNLSYDTLGELRGALTHLVDLTEVPAHAHGMQSHTHDMGHGHSDSGHGHTVSDPTHSHGVTDPGHTHTSSPAGGIWVKDGISTAAGTDYAGNNNGALTSNATGVSVNAAGTGVSALTGYANVGNVVGNTGGPTNNTTTSVGSGIAMDIANPTIVVYFIVKNWMGRTL